MRRYRLDAADGLPGAYRVSVHPDKGGAWHFIADWEGRAVAGLWLEDKQGKTLMRKVGASPLRLDARIEPPEGKRAEKLVLRFAPTTSRGVLTGVLEIHCAREAAAARCSGRRTRVSGAAPGPRRLPAGAGAGRRRGARSRATRRRVGRGRRVLPPLGPEAGRQAA
ncbi:MAG: hypothetical protein Q9Q13_00250 [Acidobacteriota bacterium]|nr:hypothetical protein [Acidobacteriota bacterium]